MEELKKELNQEWIDWGDPEEIKILNQMIQNIQERGIPDSPSFANLKEQLLFEQAVKLSKEKTFEQYSAGIQDLSFLQNLTYLRKVTLRDNAIRDLSPCPH